MSNTSPEHLIRDLPALSSLPAVVEELERALDSGEASMADLGEIVKKDTDLTARLLRLANSSFYGFPTGVETVAEALALIGIEQMKQLLTGSSVMEYFHNIPSEAVNMRSFWKHSIATGIAAKLLAVQRKAPDPELFFVAGLIHDIGRLVFYLRMPDEASRVLESYGRNPDIPLYDYEKQAYGFDHGDVAGELLKKWDFPNSLIHAVRYHHRPAHADVYYTHAALISIADFVVHSLDFGNSGEAFVPPISPDAWDRLDLPMSALRNTIKETSSQFEETVGLFLPNQS